MGRQSVSLLHEALLYRDDHELASGARAFVEAGLTVGEPAMIAVPPAHAPTTRIHSPSTRSPTVRCRRRSRR